MAAFRKNEYIITPYFKDQAVADPQYFFNRNEAIREGKKMIDGVTVDEADMQVIYDCTNPDSELSDAWWSITAEGGVVKKQSA